jgi:hypothetical protein
MLTRRARLRRTLSGLPRHFEIYLWRRFVTKQVLTFLFAREENGVSSVVNDEHSLQEYST